MSKQQPGRKPTAPKSTPTTQTSAPRKTVEEIRRNRTSNTIFGKRQDTLLFTKAHFKFMLIGVAFILGGLLLMTGGAQKDPNVWDPQVIYNPRIVTLAPIVILIGLGLQIYAIFLRSPNETTTEA
jgi:hypothetical protein